MKKAASDETAFLLLSCFSNPEQETPALSHSYFSSIQHCGEEVFQLRF
jgi:hypothetical protein